MKTTLRYLSVTAHDTWHQQVDDQLRRLHRLTPITAADVVLEHLTDTTAPYHVQVRLEVPAQAVHPKATRRAQQAALLMHGPVLQSEAQDSTLEAALLKATEYLAHQIEAKQLRRLARGKSRLQLSAMSGRWTHAQTGHRP